MAQWLLLTRQLHESSIAVERLRMLLGMNKCLVEKWIETLTMTQSSPFLSTHRRAKRSDAAAAANDTDNDDNDLTKKSSKKVRPHRIKVNFKMIGKWFSLKLGLTCLLFVFF